MSEESPERAKLRAAMRRARKARGLSEAELMGDPSKKWVASRTEGGSRPLRRPIVGRYAVMTNTPELLRTFDRLVAEEARGGNEPPDDLPPLGAVLVSAEIEQTVDVGELVKVTERRTVMAQLQPGRWATIGMHFDLIDGRQPQVRPVTGYHVDIFRQGWISRTNYLLVLRFPEGAIVPGQPPYEYALTYEFETPLPFVGLVPPAPIPHYHLTVTFPSAAFTVFEFEGTQPPFAEEEIHALARGDQTELRPRRLTPGHTYTRDFVDLKPALLYGLAWAPRPRAPREAPAPV